MTTNRRVCRHANHVKRVVSIFFVLSLIVRCNGQGTMTYTFDKGPNVPPVGQRYAEASYAESGMVFSNPYGQENLVLAGGSVAGYPEDGSGYLQVSSGAKLSFSLTPVGLFNFVSFDAAGYGTNYPPATLEVIGYKPGIMGPPTTVTNYFNVDSVSDRRGNSLPDFETFYLTSQFSGVYRVDVMTDLWSLDNLTVNGVPESGTGCLLATAGGCALAWVRSKRRRKW